MLWAEMLGRAHDVGEMTAAVCPVKRAISIDANKWRRALPNVIEAFYGDRQVHAAFLQEYGLTAGTHPFCSCLGPATRSVN